MQDLKKPIALMVVATALLAGLVVLAGFTYVDSIRKSSPFFHCMEIYREQSPEYRPEYRLEDCSDLNLRR